MNLIDEYKKNGRIPWSPGYKQYRFGFLQGAVGDAALLKRFRSDEKLPDGYAHGLDERAVEYPWVLAMLDERGGTLLDGGSALNYAYLLDRPQLANKNVVIMTLAPESTMEKRQNVSYIFGDIRETLFRDNAFDCIVSVSTLEHVGMDNAMLYTKDDSFRESQADSYLKALAEFRRILKPNGRLLVTVPFGLPQNFGWLQQFDAARLREAVTGFGPSLESTTFFRHSESGWNKATEEECSACEYFDVHSATRPAADHAAAARAVACLEFVKRA